MKSGNTEIRNGRLRCTLEHFLLSPLSSCPPFSKNPFLLFPLLLFAEESTGLSEIRLRLPYLRPAIGTVGFVGHKRVDY